MGPRTLPQSPQSHAIGRSLTFTRLGFVVALGAEARALGNLPPGWTLKVSGIGPVAATTAARALAAQGCDAIISWGVAGGLSSMLSIGDLVVPEQVQREERLYAVDRELRASLVASLATHVNGGTLITTDEVIRTPEMKSSLHRAHGAVAVDMESAAVAHVAADNGIGFAAIRAISDGASDALPPGLTVALDVQSGALRAGGVARLLLTKPHLVPRLVRAGRDFGRALATLSSAGAALRDDVLR